MFYRPNFCCHCGEKIERAEWGILTSRKFCDPCSSEMGVAEWTPKILAAVMLLSGFALIANLSRPAVQTPKTSNALASFDRPGAESGLPESNSNTTLPPQVQSQPPTTPVNANISNTAQVVEQPRPLKSSESVYFCGAMTKKGTPCSRRVKKRGERCWQHAGMPAAADSGQNFGK